MTKPCNPILFFFLFQLFISLPANTANAAPSYGDLTALQWEFVGENGVHPPHWNDSAGNMEEEVIVAVLDMGIDATHPDLKEQMYTFTPVQQAALGCGEHGYNALSWKEGNDLSYGSDHGTSCAGIIAGAWDGKGISGIASNVKIIDVRVADGRGNTDLPNVIRGYAFLKRAIEEEHIPIKIVSNSWGLSQSTKALNAMMYDLGKNYGVLSIVGAGNDSTNLSQGNWSAGLLWDNPYVVTVASTDEDGALSDYSNYGASVVDLAAPGKKVLAPSVSYEVRASSEDRTEKEYPFYEASGTSAATPCVAGAAAVLWGNHAKISDPREIASLLLSCVRQDDHVRGKVRTDGVLDFAADCETLCPRVFSCAKNGNRLVISGISFGEEEGVIRLSRVTETEGDISPSVGMVSHNDNPSETGNEELSPVPHNGNTSGTNNETASPVDPASIVSWSDTEIILSLPDAPVGILTLEIENHSDDLCRTDVSLGKASAGFVTDLPFPDDTGDPYLFDAPGDGDTAGILTGLGQKLYYLRYRHYMEGEPVCCTLEAFDIQSQTWESLPSLPAFLYGSTVSAAAYRGKLYVAGSPLPVKEELALPYLNNRPWEELSASVWHFPGAPQIYEYDPLTKTWRLVNAEGLSGDAMLFGTNGVLYVCQTTSSDAGQCGRLYTYDPEKGLTGELVIREDMELYRVVPHNGSLCILYGYNLFANGENAGYVTELCTVTNGQIETRPVTLPGEELFTSNDAKLLSTSEGLLLFAPGVSPWCDTYLLRDGDTVFRENELRVSDAYYFDTAVCNYDGKLYAIGSSYLAEGHSFFRCEDTAKEPEYSNTDACPMWRMYNPNSGEHFYTARTDERSMLLSVGWRAEWIGWTAPEKSGVPVYRLYNPKGYHHYTVNVAERDMLIVLGWRDEGIGWYSDDRQTTPLYRLYNPNAKGDQEAGGHFYTTSLAEAANLIAIGWQDERIGWYGL